MHRRSLSPDQVNDAIHLYNLGWSLARVGDHLGLNHTTVLNKLRERGIPTRHPRTPPAPKQVARDNQTFNCVDALGRASVVQEVTMIMGVVVGLTFLFGFGNVLNLALRLGVPAWVAPLVTPGS